MASDRGKAPAVKPPLLVRQNPDMQESYFALRKGIPDSLLPSLLSWSLEHYTQWVMGVTLVNQDRLNRLERIIDLKVLPDGYRDDSDGLQQILTANNTLHMQAIDIALRWADNEKATELATYLDEARSVYCVRRDEQGQHEVQYRQPEEMSELVDSETTRPGRAAEHLRAAWSKCFGLSPDLNEACIEAVKAIEVAAKPVVAPNDQLITLGKMCGLIRTCLSDWETGSAYESSIETILSMMDMVWKGHLRHGDESAPLEVSQEAAEMTVQTAVLLVSWFRSGRIRMRSEHS